MNRKGIANMGLFDKLFQSKEEGLYAPVKGEVVALSQVSDPTFGQGILGKGIAVIPQDDMICAPCNGTVDMVFDTKHAVTLRGESGVEILIHVGLDTVQLAGEHFTAHVKAGDVVRAGQLLITADLQALKDKGYDIITPMVICNTDEFKEVISYENKGVTKSHVVIGLVK